MDEKTQQGSQQGLKGSATNPKPMPTVGWWALIVLLCAGLGIYFCSMQNLLYTHYQPFFDSMSYYNNLYAVMSTARDEGVAPALTQALDGSNDTVVAPYIAGALFAPLVEPSRNFGVWLQIAELFVLLTSLFYYLSSIRKLQPGLAVILLTPFITTACLFRYSGGMSDFRMDLSLYLMFSTSCIWYLISAASRRTIHFFILGVAIAVTCLFRATAPIYLLLCLLPLVIAETIYGQQRRTYLPQCLVAIATASIGSLWFYISNFEHLHYYYFVWNSDANAKLSLAESLTHLHFAYKHLGARLIYWALILYAIMVWAGRQDEEVKRSGNAKATLLSMFRLIAECVKGTDLRLIWLALAPIGFLVLTGAGLNPYVSMPAVFGLLLCLIRPVLVSPHRLSAGKPRMLAASLAALCLILLAIKGWEDHKPDQHNSMTAHKKTIQTMVEDAKSHGLNYFNFDSSHVHYLNAASLHSAALFDVEDIELVNSKLSSDGVFIFRNSVISSVVAKANWDEVPGDKTEVKLQSLLDKADGTCDYLIVPERNTIEFLEKNISLNIINQHQRIFADHVQKSNNWTPISGPIVNSEDEIVRIFRNETRTNRFAKYRGAKKTQIR